MDGARTARHHWAPPYAAANVALLAVVSRIIDNGGFMVDLHELRRVLADEFCRAENRVVQSVRASLPRAKEDDITTLFVVEVARGMEAATSNGVIERYGLTLKVHTSCRGVVLLSGYRISVMDLWLVSESMVKQRR